MEYTIIRAALVICWCHRRDSGYIALLPYEIVPKQQLMHSSGEHVYILVSAPAMSSKAIHSPLYHHLVTTEGLEASALLRRFETADMAAPEVFSAPSLNISPTLAAPELQQLPLEIIGRKTVAAPEILWTQMRSAVV